MLKLLVISTFFGIFIFWSSALVDAYPVTTSPLPGVGSTPMTLFLLGSALSALAFCGKRTKIEE